MADRIKIPPEFREGTEEISHEFLNGLRLVLIDFMTGQRARQLNAVRSPVDFVASDVVCSNNTGTDFAPFEPVGISNLVNGLDTGNYAYDWLPTLSAPTEQRDHIGICMEAIPTGFSGRVRTVGLCVAKVNVRHANDTHAGMLTGQTSLQSGYPGPEIMWKPTGTGDALSVVHLDPRWQHGPQRCTAVGNIAAGTEGAVNLMFWDRVASAEAVWKQVTARNFSNNQMDAGATGHATRDNAGVWSILTEDCP